MSTEYLKTLPQSIQHIAENEKLEMISVPADGDCLFHCICEHIPGVSTFNLRRSIRWYLGKRKNDRIAGLDKSYYELFRLTDESFQQDWNTFLEYLSRPGRWIKLPAEFVLRVIADMYNIVFKMYSSVNQRPCLISGFSDISSNTGKKNLCIIIHISEVHWITAKVKDSIIKYDRDVAMGLLEF